MPSVHNNPTFNQKIGSFRAQNSITPKKIRISAFILGAIGGLAALGIPPFSHIGFKPGCALVGVGVVGGAFACKQPPPIKWLRPGEPYMVPHKNNAGGFMRCLSAYGPLITRLELSPVLYYWSTDEVQALLKILPLTCPNLEYLSLIGGKIGDEEANILAVGLENMDKIFRLALGGCPITQKARNVIEEALIGRDVEVGFE